MVRKVTAATAALALLASCAPESQAPVRVRALVLNSTAFQVGSRRFGKYEEYQ